MREQALVEAKRHPAVLQHSDKDLQVVTKVKADDALQISWRRGNFEGYRLVGFRRENTGFSECAWDLSSNGICVVDSDRPQGGLIDRVSAGASLFYTFLFHRPLNFLERLYHLSTGTIYQTSARFSVSMPRPLDEELEGRIRTSSLYADYLEILKKLEEPKQMKNRPKRKPIEERIAEERAEWERQQKRMTELGLSETTEEWELLANRYQARVREIIISGT